MLTKKDVEFGTWACIDYQELKRCCMVYEYSTLTPPELGREKVVRCGDIPSLVRELAIDIAINTYEDLEWDDVSDIYRNLIHYGVIEFITDVV